MNNKVFAIIKKEIKHILRDRRSLILAIVMPLIYLFVFAMAITLDIDNVKMALVDLDKTQTSRELIRGFTSSGYFEIASVPKNEKEMTALLDEGRCKIGVVIPNEFERNVKKGEEIKLQVLVDGTEANSANVVIGYVQGMVSFYSAKAVIRVLNKNGIAAAKDIGLLEGNLFTFYNRELKSKNYIIPGLIAIIMSIILAILTSLTIVKERDKGTLEQLMVTPIKPRELMLGKMIPYWLIGMLDMVLVVLVGTLVFDVPLKGDTLLLFFTTGIFAFCGLNIGLLVSSIATTQQFAIQLSMILSILPSFILSGFLFPIKSMPEILQLVTYIIPAKYFLVILRGIFLKGSGLYILIVETAVLLVFGIILLLVTSKRFSKNNL